MILIAFPILKKLFFDRNALTGWPSPRPLKNIDSTLFFTADSKKIEDALECACIQHEIDHLDGITMFDRQVKGITIKREGKKIGRNDKVTITKGSDTKVLKYKKAGALLEAGWTLSTQ